MHVNHNDCAEGHGVNDHYGYYVSDDDVCYVDEHISADNGSVHDVTGEGVNDGYVDHVDCIMAIVGTNEMLVMMMIVVSILMMLITIIMMLMQIVTKMMIIDHVYVDAHFADEYDNVVFVVAVACGFFVLDVLMMMMTFPSFFASLMVIMVNNMLKKVMITLVSLVLSFIVIKVYDGDHKKDDASVFVVIFVVEIVYVVFALFFFLFFLMSL